MRKRLGLVALIAAVGIQLRTVIVGVAPALPAVRDELHLSFTATGALVSIPVLAMSLAAIPGALLVDRFGARMVVAAGTICLGVAAILRLAPPSPAGLFVWSAVMACGAAVGPPAMGVLLRGSFPGSVQRASTVFSTSLSVGGLAGAALTAPLVGLVGWQGSFVVWGGLALGAGLAWLAGTRTVAEGQRAGPGALRALARDPAVWHVAGLFGIQSMVYYGAQAWIPFELRGQGTAAVSLTLLLLNLMNFPLSVALILLRWQWARSRAFYVLSGALVLLGTGGLALGLDGLAWLWASAIGVGVAMAFTGATALPALMARTSGEVAGYSALVLTAGYAIAFTGPFLGGAILDRTHSLTSPFWPLTAAAAVLLALGATLTRHRTAHTAARAAPRVV